MGIEDFKPKPVVNEFDDARKEYENGLSKIADSKFTRFIKKILGREDVVSEADIMISDAERENELRSQGHNKLTSPEISTSLIYKKVPTANLEVEVIEGLIDGKNVKITNRGFFHNDEVEGYVGTIDGAELSHEDAKAIFEKYYELAKSRSEKINNIGYEKRQAELRDKTKRVVTEVLENIDSKSDLKFGDKFSLGLMPKEFKGTVNGKKISIYHSSQSGYGGKIDNQDISEHDAETIFKKCSEYFSEVK